MIHYMDLASQTSLHRHVSQITDSSGLPDTSPTDRMPAISAAQALRNLDSTERRCISTGLELLDQAIQNRDSNQRQPDHVRQKGGISRGKVTEIFGPPAAGKTTMA